MPFAHVLFASDALHVLGRHDLAARYDVAFLGMIPANGFPYTLPTDAYDTDPRMNKAFMRGDFETALGRYEVLRDKLPNETVYGYLLGICLIETGKAAEGQRMLSEAHTGALAGQTARLGAARMLMRAGFRRHAREQLRMLDLFGVPGSREQMEGLKEQAEDSFGRGDYAGALHAWHREILMECMWNAPRPGFGAELRTAARMAWCQAHLAGDKGEETVPWATRAVRLNPEDIGAALALVGELDGKGQAKTAEAVFRAARGYFDEVLKEYPRSHRHHHLLAALCLGAGRDLDDAAAHARRAAEMAPENRAYEATAERAKRR